MSSFYTPTGNPGTATPGASAPIRAEFQLIAAAFDLFPTLSGAPGRAVIVNDAGTALTLTDGRLSIDGALSMFGAFSTTFVSGANTSLLLPLVDGELMTFDGGVMTGDLTLRGDPTTDFMAATRRYVDTKAPLGGPYLPLAGGVLSGALSVASPGVTYTGVGPGHAMAFGWDGSAVQAYHDGTSVGALATQVYVGAQLNGFLPLSGGILTGPLTGTTVTAQTFTASLSGGGKFVIADPAAAANARTYDFITTQGALNGRLVNDANSSQVNWLTVNRTGMTINSVALTATEIDLNGQAKISGILTVNANATINGNISITGTVVGAGVITGNSMTTGSLDASGTVTGNFVHGTTSVQVGASGGVFQMYENGTTNRRHAYDNTSFWDYQVANHTLQWFPEAAGTGAFIAFPFTGAGSIGTNFLGPWQGNGAYIPASDERMKTDIAPATEGLAEVLAIEPIRFRRLSYEGMPHERVEIGFSAQQLQTAIPEAVVPIGTPHAEGPGSLASEDPILGINIDPIVAAMCNAMKTIDARLAALEGKAG